MTTADPRKAGKGKQSASTRIVYDVIVLGSQLAGVLAGALLAKRGYRVLLIDPDGLGATYEHRGYQLPYAPTLLPHLRRMPPAEAVLTELGIAVDLFRALDGDPLQIQLLLPRHRLDLPVEADRRAAEMGRELPEHKDRIVAALAATQKRCEASDPFFKLALPFPPAGFFERRAVKKAAAENCPAAQAEEELSASLDGTPLAGALRDLSRFLTHLEDAEAGALAHTRPLAQLLDGPCRFRGGRAGLREAVRERLLALGGDALGDTNEPAEVEELLFEGGRFGGVKLIGTSHVYRASGLIVAMDVASLATLIPPRAKKHGLSELLESVRARRQLFTANLVIKDAGMPLGLKDAALIHPGDEFHGPVLIEVAPARKGGKEVAGEKVLSAAAFVPYHGEHSNSDDRLLALAKRIAEAALEIAPFAAPHIVARSAPVLDARNLKGTRLLYHPLLEVEAERCLGVTGLPHRTPCKNLVLGSREVLPGLGLEGEFLAGSRAASLVQELLKKHNPLK